MYGIERNVMSLIEVACRLALDGGTDFEKYLVCYCAFILVFQGFGYC